MWSRAVATWVAVLACTACGDEAATPPAHRGPAVVPAERAAGPDDVIVAHVNGRPVWGACVAAQAARGADRRTALDECVAFELLAQTAEARGLAGDPEVADATRTAVVDRLVATEFEAHYRSPADLATQIDKVIERNKHRMTRPEGRASAYARIVLPTDAPAERDAAAHALADRIAAALADERGLFSAHLKETAERLVADTGFELEHADVPMQAHAGLVPSYADALFAIPEVGRVAPRAVRTQWGWDVVLLTEHSPPLAKTRDDLAREMFPELRRSYFAAWVNQIARALGVTITFDQAQVARLEELE